MTKGSKIWLRSSLYGISLMSIVLVTTSQAHENDPKRRNLEPPYHGPAYHRSAGEGGIAGDVYAYDGIRLESWLPPNITSPGGENGNDCWGYVSPSGREYALMGHQDGLAIVEITEPASAALVEFIPGPLSLWRDVKTYGSHAYVVTEGGDWVQVVDLSEIDNGVATLLNTFGEGPSDTHNVVVDPTSGLLARAGAGNGLHLHDLKADPVNPPLVGYWPSIYVHDAQIHTYSEGPNAGRTFAFCCGGLNSGYAQPGLYIVEVTDPANPVELSALEYPFASYSHQGWLSPDGHYFYLDDEFDENTHGLASGMHVIDVSDPAQPEWVARVNNGGTAVSHNLYTLGTDIYAANYTSGVRIFDATDPIAPVEVAWFDTYPSNDNSAYSGLWSVYCDFPSGTFIGSDMQRGLFVWTRSETTPVIEFLSDVTFIEPTGEEVLVRFNSDSGVELQPDTLEALILDETMREPKSVPLTHLKDDLYQLVTPPLECGDITIRFRATSTNGTEFTMPPGAPIDSIAAYGWRVPINDTMDDGAEGWTVGWDDDDATGGVWELAVPTGAMWEPLQDHTPGEGGQCWITEPGDPKAESDSHDLDGTTSLISVEIDFAGLERPLLEAAIQFHPGPPGLDLDALFVEASIDAGNSWMEIDRITSDTAGWQEFSWRLDEILPAQMVARLRFRATDGLISDGIVEAAVDDVRVQALFCEPPIPGDLNGDGLVNAGDLGILLAGWGPASQGNPADINGDGQVNSVDLGLLLIEWSDSTI